MRYTLKTLCALTSALALQAGMAMAANDMPIKGKVSRVGTVESIVDGDTFILKDRLTDKNVDVHTTSTENLELGERVSVEGTARAEMIGMGHQIVNASVMPLNTSGAMGGPYEEPQDESVPSTD